MKTCPPNDRKGWPNAPVVGVAIAGPDQVPYCTHMNNLQHLLRQRRLAARHGHAAHSSPHHTLCHRVRHHNHPSSADAHSRTNWVIMSSVACLELGQKSPKKNMSFFSTRVACGI
ncbi:hypothetical protein TRIUR3_20641 [Triticum urartu]|uniref:Uncharacterized protein n=1 Tax=Triticum urartu TaxID=4572 RepID=M7ZDS0_TRIUA|nr:hypothetical protein TRIUR3_20641 [Triticum urartu]